MLEIIVENEYKQQLNLTYNKDYFAKVTGLTPGGATINTTKVAMQDGAKFNSSTLNTRNLVLTIYPRRNVEHSRINVYQYIQLKKYIKVYLKNDTRNVWIEGYVESFEGDLYEFPQMLQVSIICPNPYFKAIDPVITSFSNVVPVFTFPFAATAEGLIISRLDTYTEKNIVNESDNQCGVIVELYASGLALEPTVYNMTTNESFTIEHEFQAGDVVRINTQSGEKSLTLVRDGVETNILNQMEKNSQWFNLVVGDNIFTFTALHGVEQLQMTVKLQPIYTGV